MLSPVERGCPSRSARHRDRRYAPVLAAASRGRDRRACRPERRGRCLRAVPAEHGVQNRDSPDPEAGFRGAVGAETGWIWCARPRLYLQQPRHASLRLSVFTPHACTRSPLTGECAIHAPCAIPRVPAQPCSPAQPCCMTPLILAPRSAWRISMPACTRRACTHSQPPASMPSTHPRLMPRPGLVQSATALTITALRVGTCVLAVHHGIEP